MTQLQIVNLALNHLSQATITDITSTTIPQAVAANGVWTPCLKECLRGNNWSFAQVIELATLVSNYTPANYLYAYAYPTNAEVVWKLYNAYSADVKRGEDFRMLYDPTHTQNVIVTNCQNAYVEYTYLVTDPTFFDATFVNVLSYRLAAAMAMPLNADPVLEINLMKIFSNQMSEAQRISSYENNIKNGDSADGIVNSRASGLRGRGTSIGGVTFGDWNG